MLSWSQSVNKVVLKIHLPSLLLLFQLADSEVLATTFQTPPSVPANITKCRPAPLRTCLCLCPLVYPSTRLLSPLFIICLLSLSFRCLPFITGCIPKCKMSAERETERVVYIFNGELLYFHKSSFSLPSLCLVRRGRWDRWRRKIINKLQINECGPFELRWWCCHAH